VKDRFGSVDILINNAGINRPSPCLDISEAEWQDHFDTNVKGGFLVAQKLAPAMISKSWGRVIWISSQSGLIGIPGQPAYCSTKGAVVQLVRELGLERFRFGMTVNSVAPTVVETDLTRRRFQDLEFLSSCSRRFPLASCRAAEDVTAAVLFLTGERAGMVNCHTLVVDGGETAW
jgi:NAD(P)-dependent dehydrogenase (short-subunit alcohol dehydrogenase family)